MQDILLACVLSAGIPSALISFGFTRLNSRMEKRQKEAEVRATLAKEEEKKIEALRRQNEVMVIECMNAAICLGEATARAVQRIPDAHCNGDMHDALAYAEQVKNKHRDFIREQGIDALY